VSDESASADIVAWVLGDPGLAAQCAAAVDTHEVAARLETHGVSSRVATDTFGYPDVFAAAEVVYHSLPFVDTEPQPPTLPMGGPADLLRGALYALPALFLPVVVTGFAVHTSWWVLPIGMTVAWAMGQSCATLVWALRGRNDERSDALVALVSIVGTGALCLVCTAVAWWWLGGNGASVLLATGIAIYLAASGLLLLQQLEWALVVCMLPAAVGSIIALGALPHHSHHEAAAWSVVATVILVVAAAGRHLFGRRWRRPAFGSAVRTRSVRGFAYGLGCGLLVSVFIGFTGELDGSGGAVVVAVWPMLATLGLMEWQLRSFRSRATSALTANSSLSGFTSQVRRVFLRSLGLYVAALAVLSAAGIEIAFRRHGAGVPLLFGTVGALGVSFFLALILAASGRVDLVLVCWAATFTVLLGALSIVFVVASHISPTAGLTSLLVAMGTSIVILSVLSNRVLTSPLSY
jgi:hypothetical protein